jgi:hypothetical protein
VAAALQTHVARRALATPHRSSSSPGLTEPMGTGPKPWEPVLPVRTGSGSGRFPTSLNSKFEFKFKK